MTNAWAFRRHRRCSARPAGVVGTLFDVLGCAGLTLVLAYSFGGFGAGVINPLVDWIVRRCRRIWLRPALTAMFRSSPRSTTCVGLAHRPSGDGPHSIPARAGWPLGDRTPSQKRRVHPRACGAIRPSTGVRDGRLGSSPRARGRPDRRIRPVELT